MLASCDGVSREVEGQVILNLKKLPGRLCIYRSYTVTLHPNKHKREESFQLQNSRQHRESERERRGDTAIKTLHHLHTHCAHYGREEAQTRHASLHNVFPSECPSCPDARSPQLLQMLKIHRVPSSSSSS
jgi:hypothetical protein